MIGAGAMGGATVEGLVKTGRYKNEDITVSDPSQAVLERFQKTGVSVTTDNALAAASADVVMVCVKPWLAETVLKGIREELKPSQQLLVVIAAGVKSASIQEWLGAQCPPLFLCIPNIAIAELSSMTFLVPVTATMPDNAQGEDGKDATQVTELVKGIFDQMGETLLTDEQHLAAGTTLASCGIAYAMRYIRAAAEGGVELGFKADDAKRIVMQTMKGAVAVLEASGLHPEAAIDLVTTPGGVTIKGLNEMEHAGFTSAVIRGLKAGAK
jgi:pyrroline-5-carboxylate reductase